MSEGVTWWRCWRIWILNIANAHLGLLVMRFVCGVRSAKQRFVFIVTWWLISSDRVWVAWDVYWLGFWQAADNSCLWVRNICWRRSYTRSEVVIVDSSSDRNDNGRQMLINLWLATFMLPGIRSQWKKCVQSFEAKRHALYGKQNSSQIVNGIKRWNTASVASCCQRMDSMVVGKSLRKR